MNQPAKTLTTSANPGGFAWITIPGDWNEEKTRLFDRPDENGHHRYSGLDVIKIFKKYFSDVKLIDLHQYNRSSSRPSHGILKNELLFILGKE